MGDGTTGESSSQQPGRQVPADGFRADGCKVFAGLAQARPATFESLGNEISGWLAANPEVRIVHLETQICPSEGRVWLMIIVFFRGRETTGSPTAAPASQIVEEGAGLFGRSLEPGNASEAKRMREAAAELFGHASGQHSPPTREQTGEEDEDGPLDLPPPSDEPLDIRPL